MRTKIKNIFFHVILLAIFGLFVVSCDNEDYTGYSTMKVKSPTISITPGFTSPKVLVENGEKFEFTVSLSEPQIVDVHLAVFQIDGTATAADYDLTGTVVIPAGATSGKGSIKIIADAVIEGDETLKIQIGDQTTANAALTPITVEFTIKNLSDDDLSIGLSWAASTPTTTDAGVAIDPIALADLRLLITDVPYTTILDGADGAEFESVVFLGTAPDGTYYLVADFYDAMASPIRDLDLTLEFEQLGKILPFEMTFSKALNTATLCPVNYFIMAKIVKSGTNYTITEVGRGPDFVGTWNGVDSEFEYPSEMVTRLHCDGYMQFTGLCFGWMSDFWGETIVDEVWPVIEIDAGSGTVNIPFQPYITTLYNGAQYPYSIVGSGTIDNSGDYPELTITYLLDQDGFDPSGWCLANGYMTKADFTAKVTLDPAGLKSATVKSAIVNSLKPLVKPVR